MRMIKNVRMSKDQHGRCLEIMVAGNTRMDFWSKRLLGNRKRKELRLHLLKGLPFNPADHGATEQECLQFRADLPIMLEVRNVVEAMTAQYSMLLTAEAVRASRMNPMSSLEGDDLEIEAWEALVDSIWGYTDPSVKFLTFATYSVKNRLKSALLNDNQISGYSDYRHLIMKYEETKVSLNRPANFDEVVDAMGLNEEQTRILMTIQTRQYNITDVANPAVSADHLSMDSGFSYDYCELGSVVADVDADNESELRDVIERANLTPFEQAVLDAAQYDGKNGWQTRVAASHINPVTNKPYTRAAVLNILERARQKVMPFLQAA